jgi:hypothetical protein
MHIVDKLLNNSARDAELLTVNDGKGDRFDHSRDVEFAFKTTDKEQAEVVRDFIDDNRYGDAKVVPGDKGMHWVVVTINMPTTQHVLCAVSGLMECLAELFKISYDGWGCILQIDTTAKSS